MIADEKPFFVPNTVTPCERIAILERLATSGSRRPFVQAFAQKLPGKTNLEIARSALAAVQELPYVPGPPNEEWMQGATWTMAHGGECKALSVLLVAALRARGVPAEIVWITQTGKPLNHVTVVVSDGPDQYWAEPAVPGARLGESPYEAIERTNAWHVVGGR